MKLSPSSCPVSSESRAADLQPRHRAPSSHLVVCPVAEEEEVSIRDAVALIAEALDFQGSVHVSLETSSQGRSVSTQMNVSVRNPRRCVLSLDPSTSLTPACRTAS